MLRGEDGQREGRVILAPHHSSYCLSPQESLTSLSWRRHRLSPAQGLHLGRTVRSTHTSIFQDLREQDRHAGRLRLLGRERARWRWCTSGAVALTCTSGQWSPAC